MRLRIFDARHLNSTGSERKMQRDDYENFSQKLVKKLGKTVTMDENAFFFERGSTGSKNGIRLGSVVCKQFDATYDDSDTERYYVGVISAKDNNGEEKYKGYLFYELTNLVAKYLEDVWRDRYDCVADDDAMVNAACDALFENFLENFSDHTGINWKILRALSLQNYEGAKFQGKILFVQPNDDSCVKVPIAGNGKIIFQKEEVRRIRKLLTGCVRESSSNTIDSGDSEKEKDDSEKKKEKERALVFKREDISMKQWRAYSEKMYVMLGYACPADVPNAWEVEIEGPQKFKISFAKKDLFRVLDSQPQLIQEAYVQQWTQIRNLFEIPCEVPPDSKDSVEDFLTKVEAGNHGAAVIFMNLEEGTKAKEYMESLKKNDRGYAVEGALEPSLTVMDGAVVIDTKTKKIVYCGMIVDGLVEGKGDMARGARHNSISTFCTYFNSEYKEPVAAIVFSEDGGSTLYPKELSEWHGEL